MTVFHEPPRRDKNMLIRISADEKQRLEEEADRLGLTATDLIRRAVNAYVEARPRKSSKK